jgi:hypothetical protein
VEKTGNEDVLDEEKKDEERDAVTQRPWYQPEQIVAVARRPNAGNCAVELRCLAHVPMLAGASRSRGEAVDGIRFR